MLEVSAFRRQQEDQGFKVSLDYMSPHLKTKIQKQNKNEKNNYNKTN